MNQLNKMEQMDRMEQMEQMEQMDRMDMTCEEEPLGDPERGPDCSPFDPRIWC